ncbi:response regulator transcription factor [Microbulbifer sp. EKSA008]|uniref:response regulator transcription factor n=1 Tax=Microbulbifer sp. EKSA008 TaxID=3243367 RepID=UPI00404119DA
MVVYVIEDSEVKVDALKFFLDSEFEIESVLAFESYQSGMKAIQVEKPDLLILDMTIPNFDRGPGRREGKLRPLGGYEIMRKLMLRGVLCKAIVFTQLETFDEGESQKTFSEVMEMCKNDCEDVFMGGVHFNQSGDEWKFEMKRLINSAFKGL